MKHGVSVQARKAPMSTDVFGWSQTRRFRDLNLSICVLNRTLAEKLVVRPKINGNSISVDLRHTGASVLLYYLNQDALYKEVGAQLLNHVQAVAVARVSGYLAEIRLSGTQIWAIDCYPAISFGHEILIVAGQRS